MRNDELDFLRWSLAEIEEWEKGEFKHQNLASEIGYARNHAQAKGYVEGDIASAVIGGILWARRHQQNGEIWVPRDLSWRPRG